LVGRTGNWIPGQSIPSLECIVMGKPEAGESTGDHAQDAQKSAFQGERCRRFRPYFGRSGKEAVSLRTVLRIEPAQPRRPIAQ